MSKATQRHCVFLAQDDQRHILLSLPQITLQVLTMHHSSLLD